MDGAKAQPLRPTPSRYLLILIAVAFGILIAGVLLRPEHAAPAPVSESEALRLQMQAERRGLERRRLFFATKARQFVSAAEAARANPQSVQSGIPRSGERVVVVAGSGQAEPFWMDVVIAGVARVPCGESAVEEVVIPAVLPPQFSSGAIFNVDGQLLGLASRCGGRDVLVTPESYVRIANRKPNLFERAGIRVRREPAGLRVVALRQDSAFASAGVQTGDLIIQVNSAPVENEDQLALGAELRVSRSGRALTVRTHEAASPAGVQWNRESRAPQVAAVTPESPAANIGLRPGDAVLRVNGRPERSRSTIESLLLKSSPQIVVLRNGVELLLEAAK
jgi:S1-C subfamily serine protease